MIILLMSNIDFDEGLQKYEQNVGMVLVHLQRYGATCNLSLFLIND